MARDLQLTGHLAWGAVLAIAREAGLGTALVAGKAEAPCHEAGLKSPRFSRAGVAGRNPG